MCHTKALLQTTALDIVGAADCATTLTNPRLQKNIRDLMISERRIKEYTSCLSHTVIPSVKR